MSTGYEHVLAQVNHLQASVAQAIVRDRADIQRLRVLSVVNPALAALYTSLNVTQAAVYGVVNGLMGQVNVAYRASELSRSAQVVTKKRQESDTWREKADALSQQGYVARTLRNRPVEWLGDAGDLYRDTAQVCHQGLREMSRQYVNSARFCADVAKYHTSVFKVVSMQLGNQASVIRATSAPYLVFFKRSNQARMSLQLMLQLAAQAEAGELARDGLVVMGQRMRTELNDNDTLTHDFRADPRLASSRSSTTG